MLSFVRSVYKDKDSSIVSGTDLHLSVIILPMITKVHMCILKYEDRLPLASAVEKDLANVSPPRSFVN